jgi:lysophospholipase L1-like esterase
MSLLPLVPAPRSPWRRDAPVRGWMLGLSLLLLAACGGATPTAPGAVSRGTAHVTPTATPVPPVIYVALGASDAVGVGADNPNTQGYVPLLIARLPAGSQALNLGISGNVLHGALTNELPEAIAAHPTLVTVWLVGNDFKNCAPLKQYGTDLDALLSQLQTQTHAHVFVANLPDMSLLPFFQNGAVQAGPCLQGASGSQIRAAVEQWNTVIDAAIARHGAVLVDLFHSDLASHPDFVFRDGFHPSTAGYAELAGLFWTQIQAHGGIPAR